MLLKVCGVTTQQDIAVLARTPTQWAGLWYGVAQGHADLDRSQLVSLAAAARTSGLSPVIVTLLSDPHGLSEVVNESGAAHVQLHGFLPPRQLALVREALPHATLVKVLHVAPGRVLEHTWIPAYQDCGTDVFLFDSFGADGRVGSTGTPLDGAAVTAALDRLDRPFLLAGGLSTPSEGEYRHLLGHPGFLGIDIDTAARHDDGRFDTVRIARTASTWREEHERVRVT
ncbi:N-(5'-phosphoribosyl)anthranilate isomerase [Streptomyces sp. NPDC048338]|uniref:phosphoribosylanthranilate isomerase n=1 Tax=Streptomyces sp. NPDC048338 TaxID=3365536 RepID=UPI003711BD26